MHINPRRRKVDARSPCLCPSRDPLSDTNPRTNGNSDETCYSSELELFVLLTSKSVGRFANCSKSSTSYRTLIPPAATSGHPKLVWLSEKPPSAGANAAARLRGTFVMLAAAARSSGGTGSWQAGRWPYRLRNLEGRGLPREAWRRERCRRAAIARIASLKASSDAWSHRDICWPVFTKRRCLLSVFLRSVCEPVLSLSEPGTISSVI